jgi:hypothetical protein
LNEHQRETAFLRECIRHAESPEHQSLEKEIVQIQRDERCIQRAAWLMATLTMLAVAGVGYPAILVKSFPYNIPRLIIDIICALGLASMICLIVFVGLGMAYRKKLNHQREQCRQLITRLFASRLGQPVATPSHDSRVGDGKRGAARGVVGGSGCLNRAGSIAPG